MLKRILVPLDGSELAERALLPARELAAVFGSEVRIVSVCSGRADDHGRVMRAYLEQKAAEFKSGLRNPSATVHLEILEGDPADRIVDEARRKNVDLIVIASHGHTGILLWAMGGTAQKIIHDSPVSVLLVRATAQAREKSLPGVFGKILLPLDALETGERALPFALEIAEKLNAQVTLFGVVESGQRVHTIGGQNYVHFSEQRVVEMKNELTAYLDRTAGKFVERRVPVRREIRLGDAAHEIIKYSRKAGTRIVIMSGHSRSGLRKWVFGSVSTKVLHGSKIPLLLVKTEKKEPPQRPSGS